MCIPGVSWGMGRNRGHGWKGSKIGWITEKLGKVKHAWVCVDAGQV